MARLDYLGIAVGLVLGGIPMTANAEAGQRAGKPAEAKAAAAKSARSGKGAGPAVGSLAHALSELASDDAARIEGALSALREIGSKRIVGPILARVRDGLPPALTLQAIAVLSQSKQRSATAGLAELLAHRRPDIRRAAVEAIGLLGGRAAQKPLIAALEDPAAPVQRAAATALMVQGDGRAVPALLAAHDRGVVGAAQALGELAGRPHMAQLAERAKGPELDALSPALDRILQRPGLPIAAKVKLVKAVSASESPTAPMHLARWLQATGSAPLAQALREAVAELSARKLASPPPDTVPASEPVAAAAGGKR